MTMAHPSMTKEQVEAMKSKPEVAGVVRSDSTKAAMMILNRADEDAAGSAEEIEGLRVYHGNALLAHIEELELRLSDVTTERDKARLEAFAKTPECIEAAMIDAGRWYFLTRYVDRIARHSAGWICYYRREPNGIVLGADGASIQEAVQGGMDDVERFEKMEAPINDETTTTEGVPAELDRSIGASPRPAAGKTRPSTNPNPSGQQAEDSGAPMGTSRTAEPSGLGGLGPACIFVYGCRTPDHCKTVGHCDTPSDADLAECLQRDRYLNEAFAEWARGPQGSHAISIVKSKRASSNEEWLCLRAAFWAGADANPLFGGPE